MFSQNASSYLINLVSHLSLRHLGDVVAKLKCSSILLGDVVLLQVLNGIGVVHALEGLLRLLKVRVEEVQQLFSHRVGEDARNDVGDERLDGVQQIVKGDKDALRFNVRVLRQMTAGSRGLGSVGLRNAEGIAQRGQNGLQVQLRRLRQVGLCGQSKVSSK